jgi:hypothetical protein
VGCHGRAEDDVLGHPNPTEATVPGFVNTTTTLARRPAAAAIPTIRIPSIQWARTSCRRTTRFRRVVTPPTRTYRAIRATRGASARTTMGRPRV